MYLRRKSVKGKSYKHWLSKTLPDPLDSTELRTLVQRLRLGDSSVKIKIIEGHLRLAAQLVGRQLIFNGRGNTDDWVSVAFVAVCAAVNRATESLIDDNITPYITAAVHSELARYIAEDRIVFVPYSTFRTYQGSLKPGTVGSFTDFEINSPDLVELREIFDKACETNLDRKILDMRKRGYTDIEISKQLTLSVSRVQSLRSAIFDRIRLLMI